MSKYLEGEERVLSEQTGRRRRKEIRPDEIVDAALAEFTRNGFAGARIDDIARRAAISKGAVYLYFPSKEALFEAVVRRLVVPRVERIMALGEAGNLPPEAALRAIIEGLYAELASGPIRYILRLLISEGERFPHLVNVYYTEVISRGMKTVRTVIERGIAAGEFRSAPIVDFPQTVIAPVMMGAVWKLLFDKFHPLDLERLRDGHIDLVLNGLRRR